MRAFAGIAFSVLLSTAAMAQTAVAPSTAKTADKPTAPVAFDVADVRPSPKVRFASIYPDGGVLHGDRYTLRQASMIDLIARAYSIPNSENIQGGPSWLERTRFNIFAKAKPGTTPANLNLMLQTLLAERFHLIVHQEDRPMPAYILSLGKDKPKMKQSTGNGDPNCRNLNAPAPGASFDPYATVTIACQNLNMQQLSQMVGNFGQSSNTPVMDHTGLQGKWDFELTWTPVKELPFAGLNISDVVENQLGLKLVRQTAPRSVLAVLSVDSQPTPNVADIEKLVPPAPPKQFEVAVIKPSKLESGGFTRIDNTQVDAKGITLYELIGYAWRLNQNDKQQYVNEPKWLESTRFDLDTKVSIEDQGNNAYVREDDDLRHMVQALLIDRFHLKVHMEDRPVDAYELLAVSPKLKPAADPNARTRCTEGPGPDGIDPRAGNPMLNRLMTCQNISMEQLCDELAISGAAYLYYPPLDHTGLKGGFDVSIPFSGINLIKQAANESDAPNGAVTIFAAVSKLGLKLEKHQLPLPVLVIEHIDETPTEN